MHDVLRSSAEDDRRVEERSESLAVLYVNADDGERKRERKIRGEYRCDGARRRRADDRPNGVK